MASPRMTIRDLGYSPGQLPTGRKNSILDIEGVRVGQVTVGEDGSSVRHGVTVILPRHPDEIHIPCYAGMHTLNGNGEVSGSYQVKDWGFTNMPLALTNSCSFGLVFQGIWDWTLSQAKVKKTTLNDLSHNYGTPIVGETADWWLNDVFSSSLTPSSISQAFENAMTQTEVQEGQNGGGAGMTCHMFPGGTGTSSRVVPNGDTPGESYTVGVIVQSNYGHCRDLIVGGIPVGKLVEKEIGSPVHIPESTTEMENRSGRKIEEAMGGKADEGSIVIYLITDAPMLPHQLTRLARHAAVGLAQVGGHGVGRNFSGDIVLALSTGNRPVETLKAESQKTPGFPMVETNAIRIVRNESVDVLFRAASEATEEAVLNSMVAGREGRTGTGGIRLDGFPVDAVRGWLEKYMVPI